MTLPYNICFICGKTSVYEVYYQKNIQSRHFKCWDCKVAYEVTPNSENKPVCYKRDMARGEVVA